MGAFLKVKITLKQNYRKGLLLDLERGQQNWPFVKAHVLASLDNPGPMMIWGKEAMTMGKWNHWEWGKI